MTTTMRTPPPILLPLFRSDGQARLLARVYLAPDKPAPMADLARELDLDRGGVKREADRLEAAGLVRSERVGQSRILHPNEESPYYRELHGLLLKALGPATVIGPALAEVKGVEQAFLYGSWAARYQGEAGPSPVDIDVLVIGAPARLGLARVTRELSGQLGREVNATVYSPGKWFGPQTGFIRHLKRGPIFDLRLRNEDPNP